MNEETSTEIQEGGEWGKGEGSLIHRPLIDFFPSFFLSPWDWPGNEARKGEGREGDVEKKEKEKGGRDEERRGWWPKRWRD